MTIAVTVPTKGNRPKLLTQLVDDCTACGISVHVVRTDANALVPPSAHVIDDFGPINIQRWWREGIEAAASRASHVAVLNDDVVIDCSSLERLSTGLSQSGCTIATPGRNLRVHRSWFPPKRIIDGSCWMLNVDHGLRPNEAYRWGYGDDDLDIRARTNFGGVVTVPVTYQHMHRNEQTSQSSMLLSLAAADRALFAVEHRSAYLARLPREHVARFIRRRRGSQEADC